MNYSTSQVPTIIDRHLWVAWVLTALCAVGYLVLEFGPARSPTELAKVSTRSRRRYLLDSFDLDSIPVRDTVAVTAIQYGEGPQKRVLGRAELHALPADWSLLRAMGTRDRREVVLRTALSETDQAQATRLPHRLVVRGTKRWGTRLALYVITDLAYLQAVGGQPLRCQFAMVGLLDRGGILPYLDERALHAGQIEVRSAVGALGLIVVVEYRAGRPLSRSPYLLAVRAGIRYPQDVWLSPATGHPLVSAPEPHRARVAFESPQPNGLACDVYACDLDGRRMVNLTRKDHDSYDGLGGGELAQWVDERHLQVVSQLASHQGKRVVPDRA